MSSLQDRPNLASIRQKAETLAGAIVRTPFLAAPRLAALTGSDVRVKYENMQVTASFKERGALAKLVTLSEEERARGVIAMSAGNHAQAVAYHATRLGISPKIVMPETTPHVKVSATRGYGTLDYETGEQFDASWDRGEPIAFPLRGLIQGWQDGIPGMRVGGRRQLVIPPELAYGTSGGHRLSGRTLVFVIDLIDA